MSNSPSPNPRGPTVRDAAVARLKQLDALLEDVLAERKAVRRRIVEYAGSTMLEAERVATKAEPFQAVPLPDGVPHVWTPEEILKREG